MKPLLLPCDSDPVVSLLVVVYGRHELARATLASLAGTMDLPAETIVVDNASPDRAGARLADNTRGGQFVLRRDNVGYAAAINLAAARARAPYLAILNTDLDFADGWLGELVRALDDDPGAGAAAPMYRSENGAVQDAGGILGPDAHGYSYGDNFAPDDGEVGFMRRIDYGTAAALVVRTEAFAAVGGFDPVFGLGYFEDTDLGFALRRRGFHSLYVPTSHVTHMAGGSFGHELRRRQVDRNRPIFRARYEQELSGRPHVSRPPYDPWRELVLRDWWAVGRLLVLDPRGGLTDFVDDTQYRYPRARVTHLSPGPRGINRRVEHLPWPRDLRAWSERRRFHYEVVIDGSAGTRRDHTEIAHSQPQAVVARVGDRLSNGVELSASTAPEAVLPWLGFGTPER